ncbi:DUF72 domain-containing protein [soil metagenome]
MRGRALVGMAGWVFPEWRGGFYPKGTRQAEELEYASRHVTSIELNGSFYALQKPASWVAWRDRTPEDFVFSVKAPRYITYVKQLAGIEEPLADFFASGILALGTKLGAILWQLPAHLAYDAGLLERFLGQLPHTTGAALELALRRTARMTGREHLEIDTDRAMRHALEMRHPSFAAPEVLALLERHGVAAVYGDSGGKWPVIDADTAGFRYCRLHADEAIYPGGFYEPRDIDTWAARIEGWLDTGRDCYIYFDNDTKVRAPIDAMRLIDRLGRNA